jgi:Cu2+-exporting ATPase
MSLSTIVVAVNAQLLRRLNLSPAASTAMADPATPAGAAAEPTEPSGILRA